MKRISFDTASLQSKNPGAYAALPKSATKTGALSFYYTFDGDLRATDGVVTYAYRKGTYNAKRKRFDYAWSDVTASVGNRKR